MGLFKKKSGEEETEKKLRESIARLEEKIAQTEQKIKEKHERLKTIEEGEKRRVIKRSISLLNSIIDAAKENMDFAGCTLKRLEVAKRMKNAHEMIKKEAKAMGREELEAKLKAMKEKFEEELKAIFEKRIKEREREIQELQEKLKMTKDEEERSWIESKISMEKDKIAYFESEIRTIGKIREEMETFVCELQKRN